MSCNDNTQFVSAADARKNGRNNPIIFGEICAIQTAILSAIDEKKLEVIVNDNSPMTKINEILDVFVTNGGSGYSVFQATATVSHPTGVGAAVIPVVTGSVITDFVISASGSGYEPIVPVADTSGQGNGNAEIQLIENNGMLVQANIIVGGTGYVAGFSIPVVHPDGVNAHVQISTVDGAGAITGVSIINPGQNYDTVVATIQINHPVGLGFNGIANVTNGQVNGVTITNAGAGYADLQPTAVATGTAGSGAELSVTISAGMVVAVNVLQGGSGYDELTGVTISDYLTGTGSGATAVAQVDTSITNSLDYYMVWSGQTTDRAISDQLDQVTKYFQKLGYDIRIEVNPDTQNSIMWHIYW